MRSNGAVRDLRLPLEDGERIQILTTRDRDDPDALYVLRHSAAHLLAEAARRLFPGTKVAIGPPIENGFYYDFEFPEPVTEADLERLERRGPPGDRRGPGVGADRDRARRGAQRFHAEEEPYKVELVDTAEGDISLYKQGDFVDLCRGPHLQDAKPIKAVKLLSLAGAYWRGDETKPQLTRVYGTAFYDPKDLEAYLDSLEEAKRRDHRRLGRELDLVHFDEHSPGSPIWHPRGMVIWNALEALRQRENARRGYLEVKTPLLYDVELWQISGHWENYRDNMFLIEQEDKTYGLKPMNCPGHMLLFGSEIRSHRELPIRLRGGLDAPPRRARRHAPRPPARPPRHAGRRAHLLHARADRGRGARLPRLRGLPLRPLRHEGPLRALDATREQARRRLGVGLHRGRARQRARAPGDRLPRQRGRRRLLRAEDRPAHEGRPRALLADGNDPARRADAARFGLTYAGEDNQEHTPYVIHRALLGSLERFMGILIEHFGGDFPVWLAPEQVRVLPGLATASGRRPSRSPTTCASTASAPPSTSGRRRSGGGSATPSCRRSRSSSSGASGSPLESLAVRRHGGEQITVGWEALLGELQAAAKV